MSLIDWSDPEEMLGLLVDYVADEAAESDEGPDREQFLNQLAQELGALAVQEFGTAHRIASSLREIIESQPGEFAGDPVLAHLEACIEELQRIEADQRLSDAPAP